MNKNIINFEKDLIGLLEKWKIESKQPINSICITAKKGEIPKVEINSDVVEPFKEEKKTLSDKIVKVDSDEFGVTPMAYEKDVKEAIKEYVDDITDDSITLPDAKYMKKKAKEIFGERLI